MSGPGESAAPSRFSSWRADRGLSLQETSDLTGYSVGYLSNIERGFRSAPPMTRVQIARRLGVRVADLFDVESTPVEPFESVPA